jgi:hypothetical protein
VPLGRLVVVIARGGGATAIESGCVSVSGALSVTLAVNELVPDAVGVPLTTPVEGFKVSPAGSAPLSSDQA